MVFIRPGLDAVGFAAEDGLGTEPGAEEFFVPTEDGAAGAGDALCAFACAASGLPGVFGCGVAVGPPTARTPFKSAKGPS
jgi:hypothetical protein